MRFGIFMAPFHAKLNNPTLALERDIALVQHMDKLGYDEAWIGEHHSGGVELIPAPDIMLAVLAERTKHITLGTGVYSLAYHHPMSVAERMVFLDHITRGRVKLGVGPGALAIDAFQRGIDPRVTRERMAESLEVIMQLLTGNEPVNWESDWFTLRDAKLHLRPYTQPCFEIAVAVLVSPSGPALAGRHGAAMLLIGSTFIDDGETALRTHWDAYSKTCLENGHVPNRDSWRVVVPWHLAPTREQALREVEYGLKEWVDYEKDVANLPLVGDAKSPREAAEAMVEKGVAVIGTPQDAIEMIDRLLEQSGGFGTLLNMPCDWADHDATLRSYALFADEVMPHFQGRTQLLRESYEWGKVRKDSIGANFNQAFIDSARKFYGEDHERTLKLKEMLGVADAPADTPAS